MLKYVRVVSRCFYGNVNLWCLLTLLISDLCWSGDEPVYIHHFAVHIKGGHEAASRVARDTGLIHKGQLGSLSDHYLFEIPGRAKKSVSHSPEHHQALGAHHEVVWFEQQLEKKRVKRDFQHQDKDIKFNDPNYSDQWYLHNGAYGNYDMNVRPAWKKGITGKGIVITILDDGIERTHTDLKENYDPYASYDVNGHDHDPLPRYDPTNENRHGTRCAGEVSATANNTKCGVGIAYNSRIGGVRMLDGEVYDAVEATSLSFNRTHIDIYSASWGPDDDGRVVDGPGPLAKKAFIEGIEKGRGGKGSIFVWASGNGGSAQDSCNCDGYTNSIYTLSISSTSEKGTKPWYLEECSSTLATTYSSGAYNEKQITTDDLRDRCTSSHTGTSASAPLAAGIVALALEANPNLTWRDVQYITLMSARPEPFIDGQWVINALKRKVSLRYGYGLMDAAKMVEYALQWNNVPEQHICEIFSTDKSISLTGAPVKLKLSTNGCAGTAREVNFLEHVQAKVSLSYHRRGDVKIYLTSPSGTRSTLLPRRPNDVRSGTFNNWPFLSVHFWGESASGEWTLEIEDASGSHQVPGAGRMSPYPSLYLGANSYRYNGFSFDPAARFGTLQQWSLVLHGTATQPVHLGPEKVSTTPHPTTTPVSVRPPVTGTTQLVCHTQCADNCTGPSPTQCVACINYRISSTGECVSRCPSTGFYKELKECRPCEQSCATCRGPLMSDCLTCPAGYSFMVKDSVCVQQCLSGFYENSGQCLKCSSLCLTCDGLSNKCTSCRTGKRLWDNKCLDENEKPEGRVWLPESFQSVVVVLVILCVFLVAFILIVVALIYARNKQLLCWSYKYNKLPCSEKESLVGLTKEDLENEDEMS